MARIAIETVEEPRRTPLQVFLGDGFRPFFLFAGLVGGLAMLAWVGALVGFVPLPADVTPSLWHAHEMVFGFSAAAVAGFLLTAVPSWTGSAPVRDGALGALAALFVLTRLLFWIGGPVPAWSAALPALGFYALLFLPTARAVTAAQQKRNYPFLLLLVVFAAADFLVLAQAAGLGSLGALGVRLGLFCILSMIVLVSGRIIPTFTANALRMAGESVLATTNMRIERACLIIAPLALLLDLLPLPGVIAGGVSILAGLLLLARMGQWRTRAILGKPILWILHLGHFWLAVGFLALGLTEIFAPHWNTGALHALGAGAVGSMVLAVASRAALGHSGRALQTPRPVVAAYVMVSLAALARLSALVLPPATEQVAYVVAGLLWSAAFLIFVAVYWPILTQPRQSGLPQ